MPYINIRLGTRLDAAQRARLHEQTTALMHSIMRKRREVTVVHIQETEPQQWATNGLSLSAADPVGAYVDIKVTAGTNTAEEKTEMLSQTMQMLREVVGLMQEACYVVIDEIAADSWGYGGKTQAARATTRL